MIYALATLAVMMLLSGLMGLMRQEWILKLFEGRPLWIRKAFFETFVFIFRVSMIPEAFFWFGICGVVMIWTSRDWMK